MRKNWRKIGTMGILITCPYCLRQFPPSEMTVEHEPPVSRQKECGESKKVWACKKCNNQKSALTAEEYAEWKRLEFIRNGGLSNKQR